MDSSTREPTAIEIVEMCMKNVEEEIRVASVKNNSESEITRVYLI